MLIFGHPSLPSETLYHIDSIEAIASTPAGSTLLFAWAEENLDIVEHCRLHDLPFALHAASLTEAIFAQNVGARYILVEKTLAKSVQRIAETYLFDAKILTRIEDDAQIEVMAYEGIDGVLFAEAIVKVTA